TTGRAVCDDPAVTLRPANPTDDARRRAADGLRAIGVECHARGWSRATSSNYSVRLSADPLRLLVTASGKHKDRLGPGDFVVVGPDGQPAEPTEHRSSAETMLHVVLAEATGVGAILHTHSVRGTLLSDRCGPEGVVTLAGYEMLKALPGISTHDTAVDLAIVFREIARTLPVVVTE
ncbi:MAG: class II aldolase/adducin family protein, partial [Actinomycetota bacterium]